MKESVLLLDHTMSVQCAYVHPILSSSIASSPGSSQLAFQYCTLKSNIEKLRMRLILTGKVVKNKM